MSTSTGMRWWRCGCAGCVRGVRGARAAGMLVAAVWCVTLLVIVSRHSASSPAARDLVPPPPASRLLLQSAAGGLPSTSSTTSPPPLGISEDEIRADAERRLPSLPLSYWSRHRDDKNKFYKNKDCAPLPSVFDLEYHNLYWQTARTTNGTFHLYGAYLDERNTSRIGPAIRMLVVHDRVAPTLVTHCQIWFEGTAAPSVVRTLEYKYVWNRKWGNYRDGLLQPYLLACVLPPDRRDLPVAAVSLVERPCARATNLLAVHGGDRAPVTTRGEVAVCVKGLDFLHEDLSFRLVEWIELLLLLGAEHVYMYELQVHPNVRHVLQHYTDRGLVTVTPLTLPGAQPNLPALQHLYLRKKTTHKRQMELVPYNDCLYRHMRHYRYLALLDVDEVIVPLLDHDWPSLLARLVPLGEQGSGKPPRSSYHASNVYFLDSLRHDHGWRDGAPRYMHMLQHVWRTANFTRPGQFVKAFHNTDRVLTLHNHFPLACLGGGCSSYQISTEVGRLQHYRADCVSQLTKTCAELRAHPVKDEALWRWSDPLVERVKTAIETIGLAVPDN